MRLLRKAIAILAIVLSCTSWGAVTYAQVESPARQDLERVNVVRVTHPLVMRWWLRHRALAWAWYMADHDFIADDVVGARMCWRLGGTTYGSNVGVGPDWLSIQQAMEQSPPHLANVLDHGYRWVGIGVVHRLGLAWMVQDYCG